ncbi:MAG: hypothetical protein ACRDQ4_03650 [Pseudonocardiaceae bacterium]
MSFTHLLDWRSHTINEHAEHPLGVLKAECGHLLIMVITLHEKPSGVPCQACATLQLARTVTDGSGRSRPPLSGDDEPDPQAWITYVGDCGHRRVMSNPAHIGPCPDCDAPDPQP